MAGERTPDQNAGGKHSSSSSDNDISLREHVQRQLDLVRTFADRITAEQREYFLSVLSEMDRRYEQRFDAQKEAILKSETASERRFDSVNEFRQTLTDQAQTFMPRSESEVRMNALAERVDTNAQAILATAAIQSDRISKLELDVRTQLATSAGKSTGVDKTVAWIFAAAGFLGTLVALVAYFGKS